MTLINIIIKYLIYLELCLFIEFITDMNSY